MWLLSESKFFAITIKCWSRKQRFIDNVDAVRFIERDSLHTIKVQLGFIWEHLSGGYDSHVLAVPSLPTSTCWRTTFPRKILSLIWALRLAWWLIRISLSICNNSMISGVSSFPYEFLTNSLGPHSVTELSEGKDLWTTFSLRNQSFLIWPGAGTRTEWREGRSRSSDIFPGRWIWRAPCYEARLKAITEWRDAGRHNLFLLSVICTYYPAQYFKEIID